MSRHEIKLFLKQLVRVVSRDQTTDQAAQLAYWSTLALFPFGMFLLTVIGYLPLQGIYQELMTYVYRVMPTDAAQLVDKTASEVIGKERGGLLIIALIAALWSASGGVSATISSLNRAYEVEETRPYWKVKLISLAMTISAAAMIIVSVIALMIGPGIAHHIFNFVGLAGVFDLLWTWLRWPVIILSMMIMTAMVYYFLPNVKQKFRIITPGAVTAILLWLTATMGFNFYVSHFASYAKTYGTLGTAIVLMTWLYISGFVVILGGEINALLDRMIKGIRHTERNKGPVTVTDQGKMKGEEPNRRRPKKMQRLG